MKDNRYQELVEFLFNREVLKGKKWFFEPEFKEIEICGDEFIEQIKQVFKDISVLSKKYTCDQISLGLEYAISQYSDSMLCYNFVSSDVPEKQRLDAISSMSFIFEDFFDKKSSPVLSSNNASPISLCNELCYMWWEIFPRHGIPRTPEMSNTDSLILNSLEFVLSLDNIACKESALHGLGHWGIEYPEEVENIIRRKESHIPSILQSFSEKALSGNMG